MNVKDRIFIQDIQKRFDTQVIQEYRFHPKRRWRIDFYLPEYGIAIEIEGAVWKQGRHTRGKGYTSDMEKYNEISIAGLSLLRFTPYQMNQLATLDTIGRMIDRIRLP